MGSSDHACAASTVRTDLFPQPTCLNSYTRWEPDSGPLQEQRMLLTTRSSLQPLLSTFQRIKEDNLDICDVCHLFSLPSLSPFITPFTLRINARWPWMRETSLFPSNHLHQSLSSGDMWMTIIFATDGVFPSNNDLSFPTAEPQLHHA